MNFQEFQKAFNDLKVGFPKIPSLSLRSEKSPYGDYIIDCNNVYYAFDAVKCEDGFYLYDAYNSKNSIDCYLADSCELCHEVTDSSGCYNGSHLLGCEECVDCSYCISCMNCQNCFGSVCLSNKRYCFFNKQLSKEEYEKKVSEYMKVKSSEEIFKEVKALEQSFVPKTPIELYNEDSNALHYAYHNKNCYYLSTSTGNEEAAYVFDSHREKNTFDTSYSVENESCYELTDCVRSNGCFVGKDLAKCINCYFSENLVNCSDCIGCMYLSSKQYCILNKQYTKEEYEKIKNEILSSFKPSMLAIKQM